MSENNKLDEKNTQPVRPTGEEGVGQDREHLSEIGSKQPDIGSKQSDVGNKSQQGQKQPVQKPMQSDKGHDDLKNS